MLTAVADWVRNIILVVLFASFLELLLPASSMQRFVRVIMGLLIMLAILNPVIDLVHYRLMPQPVPAISGRSGNPSLAADGGAAVVKERNRLAVELYKNDLAKQMRAVILAIDGVADAKVAVETQQADVGRPGAIEKVLVYVQPGLAAADRKVATVTIGEKAAPKPEEIKPALKEKIIRAIAELYQLRDGQVEIIRVN
jgi:stage III sporulation protein AF